MLNCCGFLTPQQRLPTCNSTPMQTSVSLITRFMWKWNANLNAHRRGRCRELTYCIWPRVQRGVCTQVGDSQSWSARVPRESVGGLSLLLSWVFTLYVGDNSGERSLWLYCMLVISVHSVTRTFSTKRNYGEMKLFLLNEPEVQRLTTLTNTAVDTQHISSV